MRLADESSLTIPASRGSDGTLIAENDGVTYSVSPKVFLVSEGDNVIYRDSWIEFQQDSPVRHRRAIRDIPAAPRRR